MNLLYITMIQNPDTITALHQKGTPAGIHYMQTAFCIKAPFLIWVTLLFFAAAQTSFGLAKLKRVTCLVTSTGPAPGHANAEWSCQSRNKSTHHCLTVVKSLTDSSNQLCTI